ncbi:eukaryotic translation initiation factor 5A-1-like [Saccoglossus kowalevskii]|uniref:Eukaryotic translation initiation factor 5A-1-like n=1 Tax=Saccoglossus kowalevskii TaxID=10224 RepID=A0ABM0MIP3_SACKO|nr:PREDICTED: eukaryotic translation initiation factor 5A-1-like [Saccoglossus kowalevskii]
MPGSCLCFLERFVFYFMSHDEFTGADASASHTYPARCSSLRKGGHVILNSRPCKIVDISTAKPGKHGHAKVIGVYSDELTLMNDRGELHHVSLPSDDALKQRIQEKYDNEEDFLVTLLMAMDDVMVVAVKDINPYK